MYNKLVGFIRDYYQTNELIPLHAPIFSGNEKNYVLETIESTYVSSIGSFVDRFEKNIAKYTSSPRAIATVNGTAALHICLLLAGVERDDIVITQALTFVATCNAIRYCQAEPLFIDVDKKTLGLSPTALARWLENNAERSNDGICREKFSKKIIRACVPMHTFGHPSDMDELLTICATWNINLIEDATESLGSLYKGKHTGTFGKCGTYSFNGNKIITTGGGGMIVTDEKLGDRAKHITTTAKIPHPYAFVHDELGYNYRMPNINAALGCAQLEQLDNYIQKKRELASLYEGYFINSDLQFIKEPENCRSNYWLNAVICSDYMQRDEILKETNKKGIMTRPLWTLMHELPMYKNCLRDDLKNSKWLQDRVINLPSSVINNV
jgi:aminotransferase in exopolysaccharide biosynthesis